ncbi:mesothelin-like protein isoform X2 [Gouania willdenowi]|uniref:mesothelin-like protein isoform X2 n=1 Tax=Gouania willdenowi TaxID=441366 RepID=UPI001055C565|nr:mesothelin-like protein isoform X2 [Gouania willdenowi]
MYNHIKGDSDVINFELYPPDLLLYYDYSLVLQASCRSYFEQLGDADFSLFSQTLSYKRAALIQNAIVCLGITNTSLTKDNILVLGNMCCFLDAEYIQTSDPFILEELKTCEDSTNDQRTAVENLLMTGATPYGIVSQWISGTLEKLGMLPLHFTSDFYAHINKREMRNFVRYFKKVLKRNGVGREKRRKWIKEIRKARRRKSKRSVDARCEVGEITSVTVSDESFPFDYSDISQFEYCLMPTFVKEHLNSITDKVDEDDYLKIVLNKLNEAYSNSSSIPENEVQQFGPMSRVATVEDIRAWTITELDTLELLMVSSDGPWNLTVAEAVVLKYLSVEGNKLGSLELNIIQGEILCSLGTDVLMNISYQSLREMDPPDVSSCSLEKKKLLFHIIRQESTNTRSAAAVSADEYQLTQPYLGGADSEFVQSLVQSNINMDMPTFTSLDQEVVLNLSVSNVKDLLGTNVAELKSYENNSLVQNWTSRQLQSELNRLGVGLMGGRADTTASSSSPNTAVTVTPGAATNATGVPSNPTNATGVTLNPTNATGVTSNPTNATGVTSNPTNATGVPSNPTNATGVPSNPTNATGVPSNPTNATGVTSNPTNATGVTSNPTNATGVTSKPTNATGVTSNPTNATNPSNSSTAVPGSSSGGSTGGSNNVTTTTTAATTIKGHASRIRSDAGFSFLVMLTLLYFM